MTYKPFEWVDWVPDRDFKRSALEKIAAGLVNSNTQAPQQVVPTQQQVPVQRPVPQAQPQPQQQPVPQQVSRQLQQQAQQPARIQPSNQKPVGVPTVVNQDRNNANQVVQVSNSQQAVTYPSNGNSNTTVSNMIARGRAMRSAAAQAASPVNHNTQQTNSAAKANQSGVAPKAQISSGGRGGTQPVANPQQVNNASTTPNTQVQTNANRIRK